MSSLSSVLPPAPRRYLALWFPFLPADRLRRRERLAVRQHRSSPSPDEPPRVFVEKIRNALRIAAVDRQARALGLDAGLVLADARARVPGLDAVEMDRAADAALIEGLADFCDRYTPLVGLDAPDGLVLDITGCARLFGGEEPMRADLLSRLAGNGFEARASIAGTPEAAGALARFGGAAIVMPGGEAAAVGGLPVAALGVAPQIVAGLARAGLKTIGDIAGRPRVPLAARFGEALVDRLARVLGERDIRFTPRRPLPVCSAERRFAEPLARDEDVLAALASLCARLTPVLERRGEGGRGFEAAFFLVDGQVARIPVEAGRPQRDAATIAHLFRHRIEALPVPLDPGYGFDLIRLTVTVTDPFVPAPVELDGRVAAEEEVAALVDRLVSRFGAAAVRRFVPVDSHIPERAARAVPAMAIAGAPWGAADRGAMPRPVHMFDPPQPIEALAEVPDGPPLKFRWRRVLHEVARAEGPERIAAEWWHHDGMTRDYYRVEDDAGRRFWVFRQGLYASEAMTPRWFLHGIFA